MWYGSACTRLLNYPRLVETLATFGVNKNAQSFALGLSIIPMRAM